MNGLIITYKLFNYEIVMLRNKELELLIYNYIKEHENDHIDIVDLACAFPSNGGEKLLNTISSLRVNGYIEKVNASSIYYYYIIIKDYEN